MKLDKPDKARFCRGFGTTELILFLLIVGILIIFLIPKKPRNHIQNGAPTVNQPQRTTPPPGTIIFNSANVSLAPGEDWQQLSSGPFTEVQSVCLPVLKGEGKYKGSLIQVYTTAANSDAKTAAGILKSKVESDPNTLNGTFKQEEFNSVSGVRGIQVSYDYESSAKKLRTHVFLFQNAQKKCIAINYITYTDKDSERADQRIIDTLQFN